MHVILLHGNGACREKINVLKKNKHTHTHKMACSLIYNRINFIWHMEELPQEWRNLLLYLFIGRIIKPTVRIIKA